MVTIKFYWCHFMGILVTGQAMLTRENVFKSLISKTLFLMLTVTDRTGELHYHFQLMRKEGCTVFFTNLNLSTFFHKDSVTEIVATEYLQELHQSLEPTLPIWFKVFGLLAPHRTIHPGEGTPGNPQAFAERRLQIPSTQEQYFSRKATTVTALPPRIHWRRLKCICKDQKVLWVA